MGEWAVRVAKREKCHRRSLRRLGTWFTFSIMAATRFSPLRQLVQSATSAVVLGVLAACSTATTHNVRITSAVDPAAKSGYAYALAPDRAGRERTDAFHAEVVERIRTALSQRGMYEASNPARADVVVSFDYGEYPPQTHVTTVTEPMPVSMVGPGGMGVNDPFSSQTPGSSLSRRSGLGGGSGMVMVESLRVTQTSEKYLKLDAVENNPGKARVWSVDATVEDDDTPIGECIPAMVDAVIEYIGYRTPQPEKVVIKLGADGPRR